MELTVEIQGNRVVCFFLDPPEQPSAVLQIPYSPELLKGVGGVQSLRSRLFQPALHPPNDSVLLRHRYGSSATWGLRCEGVRR